MARSSARVLTEGNPAKLILLFAIPLLIGNLFQQLYSMADAFIVGRTLGVDALAAVGCTGSITFFIIGFAQGLSNGLSIVTAQRFGAGDEDGVRKSFGTSIVLCAATTVTLTVVSLLLCRTLLQLLQTPPEILDSAVTYLSIIFAGMATSVMFNLLSNMIRALGDSRTPLYFLIFACLVNIVLDYVLILVFRLGVAGAALATVASQLLSGVLCIGYIARRFPLLHPRKQDLRPEKLELMNHARVAFPMAFQMSIIAIGAIATQFVLNGLGATAVAAYTAAQKIDSVATMPLASFGAALATYTAQNYGARKYDRIRKGALQCGIMSISVSLVMAVVMVLFGRTFSLVFVGAEASVADLSAQYLWINGICYWILSILFLTRFALQGLGRTFVPTLAGMMELLGRLAAAMFLAGPFGFAGISWANPLAWIGACIPLVSAFLMTMRRLPRSR